MGFLEELQFFSFVITQSCPFYSLETGQQFWLFRCSWGRMQLCHGLYKSYSWWIHTTNNCNQHNDRSGQCRKRSFAAISVDLSQASLLRVWLFGQSRSSLLRQSRWVNWFYDWSWMLSFHVFFATAPHMEVINTTGRCQFAKRNKTLCLTLNVD